MPLSPVRPLLTLLVLAAIVAPVWGQSDLGTVSGFVKDPSGATIASAKITVRNNRGVEFFHAIVIEQQPLFPPSLRCQDEIGVVDRITQLVPGNLQSVPAMPHVRFEQRQQRRVVFVENDLYLPGRIKR